MKTENKPRKLSISKRNVLHLSGNPNPEYWIKTSGYITCPSTSAGVTCYKGL